MILSLGAPLYQEHKDRLNRLLPGRFYELYGLTEGLLDHPRQSRSRYARPARSACRRRSSTRCASCARTVPTPQPGEIGEIVGRGPILMTGYYNRPDLTEQAIRDGWLFTGDMGYVDDEGYLTWSTARRT